MKLVRPSVFTTLDFLVERRFPGHRHLNNFPLIGQQQSLGMSADEKRRKLEAIKAYREELEAKSPEEIQALYTREYDLAQKEALAIAEREEQLRPFNTPSANADFAHWSRATYWTLDEALALALGRAPEVVTWKEVEPYTGISRFAKEFARTRDLLIRAKNWDQLSDPVLPVTFLAWAKRAGIPVPSALIAEVEARGIIIADWEGLHDRLKADYEKLIVDRDKIADVCQQMITERNSLKERIGVLEQEATSWQFDDADACYPEELDIAMQAWRAVSTRRNFALTPKQQILEWLAKHYPTLRSEQRTRIAVVCNWEKQGGRRPSETKGLDH